jgi:hypothetical protein
VLRKKFFEKKFLNDSLSWGLMRLFAGLRLISEAKEMFRVECKISLRQPKHEIMVYVMFETWSVFLVF